LKNELPAGFEKWSTWVQRRVAWWLGAIALFFVYDIVRDVNAGEIDAHTFVEALVFAICTALIVAELRRNRRLRGRLAEAHAHSQRLSGEFAEYVNARLAGWALSRSEQEIAWLILKGYSFTEIAALRSVQEKTVRQQATSIYAKSGCGSRNEFIAHFIEDLLTGEHQAEK
jgi:DNA-binding CsgD family transcriptional regulator